MIATLLGSAHGSRNEEGVQNTNFFVIVPEIQPTVPCTSQNFVKIDPQLFLETLPMYRMSYTNKN